MSAQRTFGGLFRRRLNASPSSAADPAPVAPDADVARPVEGYLESGPLDLVLHGPAGRLSDILNRSTSLRVSRSDGAAGAPDLAEVLLLVPPHESGDPQRHLHRPGRALRVFSGPYEVTGDAHIPPGAQPTGFILRVRPRWLALTNAKIRSNGPAVRDEAVPVVLVNLERADRYRDVMPEEAE